MELDYSDASRTHSTIQSVFSKSSNMKNNNYPTQLTARNMLPRFLLIHFEFDIFTKRWSRWSGKAISLKFVLFLLFLSTFHASLLTQSPTYMATCAQRTTFRVAARETNDAVADHVESEDIGQTRLHVSAFQSGAQLSQSFELPSVGVNAMWFYCALL